MSHVQLLEPLGLETLAIRSGQHRSAEGEHNDPIFTTSSFVFKNAAQAAERFTTSNDGNVYSRFTNPTVQTFEERLATLEGARYGIASASGMCAILSLCLGVLKSGDHVVASDNLFGSSISLFTNILSRFGIETDFVSTTNVENWRDAIRDETRLLFAESPTNPLAEITDIRALSALAESAGALLVVDNCLCTPVLQQPLALGAHAVVHSATKYLDGQGRCVGGAVVTNSQEIHDAVFAVLRTGGTCMSPFNAWVFLKGLETLSLRMRGHCESALTLASWLESQEGVGRVYYPGLDSHPQHQLAASQQTGFGGIVTFDLSEPSREKAFAFIDGCQWLSITGNFGDVKSTITHPATTTHGRLTQAQRDQAGIGEGLIRVSAGLENVQDIQAELQCGLAAARAA